MNTKHLTKLIHYNLLFCLLCLVLQVQAATPITSLTGQKIHTGDVEIPSGLSASDWAIIRSQILADEYRHQPDQQHGYTSSNPAHGWNIHFAADGTTSLTPYNNTAKAYHLGMKLSAVGYKSLQSMDKPQQITSQNATITYQWNNNLREWWINSDTQLEQWFSLAHKPAGATRGQPLTLQLSLDTNLKAVQTGNTLHFETPEGNTIRYEKLKVWDATGKQLSAHMKLAGNTLNLIVNDADASYPLTIDPSFQQEAYIKASIIDSFDEFGWSVAISGNTIVIGTPGDASSATGVNGDHNNDLFQAGAAYVFVHSKSGWSQQAYLKASNTDSSEGYGKSVAISGDTIVVGAFEENSQGIGIDGDQGNDNAFVHSGAVYVYTRNGINWNQSAYLKASNTDKFDNFGRSVAIDGDTIAVGAIGEDSNATGVNGDQENNNTVNSGAVYVFTRNAGNWGQQAYLKASNSDEHDRFGFSVAIDGDTIVVGARDGSDAIGVNGDQSNNNAPDSGAVYVFTREGSIWSQQAYLKSSNSEKGDRFGRAVAISGNTLVVTATGEDSNSIGVNSDENNNLKFNTGAAYVFLRNEASWTQQAYLKPADTSTAADYFGNSVSISGNMVAVGTGGGAYVFYQTGVNWNQIDHFKVKTYTQSVAISGETVVVGTPSDDENVTGVNNIQPTSIGRSIESGAAYVFQLDNITIDPLTPGSISGYVWLDNNADGLQGVDEPPFLGAISIALHQNLKHSINFNTEPIEVIALNENGRFVFKNLLKQDFSYHICTSTEFLLSGLSITTRDAGNDDSIDSDFDGSSCVFALINGSYDLGLIGQSTNPNQPTNPTNPIAGNQVKGFVWLDNNGDGL